MRYLSSKAVLAVVAIAAAAMPVASQTPPAQKLSFEGLSIKPTKSSGMLAVPPVMIGRRFLATNVTLKDLLFFAYSPQSGSFLYDQIIGGPTWIDRDHFDVEAQVKGKIGPISRDKMQVMVQSLLEDRFQMKVHRQTQELPVLELVVGESGPILGYGYLMLRVAICLFIVRRCWAAVARGQALPFLMIASNGLDLVSGQFGQPTTLGFAVLFSGLALASIDDSEPEADRKVPQEPARRIRGRAPVAEALMRGGAIGKEKHW